MIKEELLALLEQVPAGADVRIDQPTHDYWRTHLAADIRGISEEVTKVSDYHNGEDAIEEEWDGDGKRVWVIR